MKNKPSSKIPVSERALIQRINRKLPDEVLKKCPETSQAFNELGSFYTVNVRFNAISDKDVDIEELGRSLGALKPFEELR